MHAHEFTSKWIDLDEEVPDFANDPSIPIMVKRKEDGLILSIKELIIEQNEPGGYTVWINVEDF